MPFSPFYFLVIPIAFYFHMSTGVNVIVIIAALILNGLSGYFKRRSKK
jgi:hypothetical protein